MVVTNYSTAEVSLIYKVDQVALTEGPISKVGVAIIMAMFFIYFNAIMVYTLRSKTVFKETPRYILFTHMLFNDSIQLLFTTLLFILYQVSLKLMMTACAFIVFVSTTTFNNAPLTLALMSLERYVAICFPLRHAEIATQKLTHIAIGVIWCIGSVSVIIDLFYVVVMDSNYLTLEIFCARESLFIKEWQVNVFQGFIILNFVSVTMIMLFTYISILITARSISSNNDSATKAHRTVLLHLIQLGLCLISFLRSIMNQSAAMARSRSLVMDLQYVIYLFVVILPRCLSPLIYGLRDNAVRPLFMYYFQFATGKHKCAINVH